MLKDLTKTDWLNILKLPDSRIPAVLILRGTRNFQTKYRAMLPHFANVLEVGTPNGIIEDVLIGDVSGCPVGFACVGRVASKLAMNAALSEYLAFKSSSGALGAGRGSWIARACSDGGVDTAGASEEPTAVVPFAS